MVLETFISPDKHTLTSTPDYNNLQDNFEPFSPELESTQPMKVISNLPQLKDCEFDHQYINQHIEQLQMDPTLCSKCCPVTKYFCSPEPVVQELYKKSCHWRRVPGTSSTMDIEPYKKMKLPYYYLENIGVRHPENRPRGHVHIKRVFQFPEGSREFTHSAKMSSLAALRTLQDKPAMARELTYKLMLTIEFS